MNSILYGLLKLFGVAIIFIVVKVLIDSLTRNKNSKEYKLHKGNPKPNPEVKIKTKFPPYKYSVEDAELAKDIKGLELVRKTESEPFGPQFYFKINNSTTSQDFERFLNSLPTIFSFQFYRPFEFKKDSLGTNVTAQSDINRYLCKNYSHGQTNICYAISSTDMLAVLLDCKDYQNDNSFRVFRSSFKFEEGK